MIPFPRVIYTPPPPQTSTHTLLTMPYISKSHVLGDPFYTFAFERLYISCQGFIVEQWVDFPFIQAYVTFTSLTQWAK